MKKIQLPKMIDHFRKEKGWTMKELGQKMGKAESTVSLWISGKRSPMVDDFDKLVTLFETDSDTLMYGANTSSNLLSETVETMKRLEEPRQESVLKFAKVQLDRQNFDNSKLINMKHFTREKRKPKYTAVETIERVSAGFGFHYGENEKEIYYTLRTDLPKFDFATVVVGDSMEPLLHDGDVILIRQSYDIPQGGIYVVDYDETSWVKEVTLEDDVLILHSVNEKYRDRFLPVPAEDGEYWSIVGEVVDWFTPEMI